jgi:signal transduction histidine kinase
LQTIIIVTAFSAASVILLTLFVSHKIAGPLYRLKREIDKLGNANFGANFQIRTTDQLKDLSLSLTSMSNSLRDKMTKIKAETLEAKKVIDGIYFENKKQVEEKINRIESVLGEFKGI